MINIYDKGLKWPPIMNIILLTLFVFKQACTCEGFFIISILIHSWRILKKKWRINLCSIILLHTIFFFNLIFISSVQLFGNYFIYNPPPQFIMLLGGGPLARVVVLNRMLSISHSMFTAVWAECVFNF